MRPIVFALLLLPFIPTQSRAEEPEYHIVIQDHRFTPEEIQVPAGRKLKLVVENRGDDEEEFESYSLNREKVVPPHQSVTVWVGPLDAGIHSFFGDFHPKTAQGRLIAQ